MSTERKGMRAMARSMKRRSWLSRLFTTYLTIVVVVMFTGIGTSVPVSFAEESATEGLVEATPLEVPVEPAPPSADEGPPSEGDPAPAPDPEDPPAVTEADPADEPAPAPRSAPAPFASLAEEVTLSDIGSGDVSLEGVRKSMGWTTGNLQAYQEGEWVPFRLIIDNTKGQAVQVTVPELSVDAFHYKSGQGIYFDRTTDYLYYLTSTKPATGDPRVPQPGWSPLALSQHDVPVGGAYGVDASGLLTTIAGGQVVIPAGQYAVIYFRAHLALTIYWNQQDPPRDGWGPYTGSPGNMQIEGLGRKTVPLPAVEAPSGSVTVYKYYDTNRNGVRDTGENEFLPGWDFRLTSTGGDDVYSWDIHGTTDMDGKVVFSPLPPGSFEVTETLKPGWETATVLPMALTLGSGENLTRYIGNYRPDVTKTFELTFAGAPQGATFFARFWVAGVVQPDVALTAGPNNTYSGSVDLPFGSTITRADWYASFGGEDILLRSEMLSETLESNLTNRFTYSSALSGMKFHDLDADGVKDAGEPGLGGWTIRLHKGGTLYAQTTTAADGSFSFVNVLPGSYQISEVLQDDWYQTLAPTNPIVVAHGSAITGLDFGNFYVDSNISIDKTGPAYAYVGEEITYTITVENTGNYTLYSVKITDPKLGVDVTLPTLAPNVPYVIDVPYTVQADDPDPLPNTAYVMATDLLDGTLTDDDSHLVDILKPAISLAKSVSPGSILLGDSVVYTFVVTNSGEETLTGVFLDDPDIEFDSMIGMLTPGEVVTLTAPAYFPAATMTNTAVVEGYDVLQTKVDDTDSAMVSVYDPGISIDKTGPAYAYVGEEITYTITVENTGDHTLTNVKITDPLLDVDLTLPSLAAGATYSFDVPYTVMADDEDPLPNRADVIGTHILQGTVTAFDTHLVDILKPAISVVKQADLTGVTADMEVTYYYLVTNSGEETLTAISVEDDKLGLIGTIDELAPGAWELLDHTTMLDETTTNIADVVGYDPIGNPVDDSDDETVVVLNPALSIVKTVDPEVVLPGEMVTYTFVITNDGDTELYDLSLVDDKLGPLGTRDFLAPLGEWTVTATTTIDVDTPNVGTVEAYYGWIDESREISWEETLTASDDAFVRVVNPAISVTKSASADFVFEGEDVTYTFVVENTGDVPLYDVLVSDDHLGVIATIAMLDVGESQTFTATTALFEPTLNVVVASGADEWGHEVSDTDEAFVDIEEFLGFPPDLAVQKSGDRTTADPGDTITYTVTVRNVGGDPAYDYTVVDDFDERYLTVVDAAGGTVAGGRITWNFPGPLVFGTDHVITYKLKVADDMPEGTTILDNVVVVTHPDDDNPDNDRATWRVTVDVDEPFLPFTGGNLLGLIALAAAATIAGLALRRRARTVG